MTIYDGWDDIAYVESCGTNPDSEHSIVVYAKLERKNQNHYEPSILISQVITKETLEDFTEDELFPIESVTYTDPQKKGGYGPVQVRLKYVSTRKVDFEGMEGQLML